MGFSCRQRPLTVREGVRNDGPRVLARVAGGRSMAVGPHKSASFITSKHMDEYTLINMNKWGGGGWMLRMMVPNPRRVGGSYHPPTRERPKVMKPGPFPASFSQVDSHV